MGTSIDRFLERTGGTTPQSPPGQGATAVERFLSGTDTTRRLSGSATQGAERNPDTAARVLKMQARTGLAPDLIEDHLDAIEAEARRSGFDAQKFRKESPIVAGWLAEDPNRMAVARADLQRLQDLERNLTRPHGLQGSLAGGMAVGLSVAVSGVGHLLEAGGETFPGEVGDVAIEMGSALQRAGQRGREFFRPAITSVADIRNPFDVRDYLAYSLGQAAGSMVPVVAGSIVGGPVGGAAVSGAMAFGDVREELEELDPEMAAGTKNALSLGLAVPIAALDRITPGQIAARLAGRGVTKEIVAEAAKYGLTRRVAAVALQSAVQEGGTELAQEMIQMLGTRAATGTPLNAGEAAVRGVDAVIGGVMGGGFFGGSSEAIRARKGRQNRRFFEALGDATTDSELVKRLPEAMQEVVQRLTADGPVETVYADVETWNEYWQSKGADPAIEAETVLGDLMQYDEAMRTGGMLAIPTARYAVTIAPSEHNAFFVEEMRLGPDAMNARESTEFAEQAAKATAETEATEAPTVDAGTTISERVAEQLMQAGLPDDQARTNAALVGAGFSSLGQRVGVDPLALFERYGLTIERQESPVPDETAMEQSADPLSGTRVVDEAGQPKRVFHGTGKVFDGFDPKKADLGFWFTDDATSASEYSTISTARTPNVRPARLNIRNPVDLTAEMGEQDIVRFMEAARQVSPEAEAKITRAVNQYGETWTWGNALRSARRTLGQGTDTRIAKSLGFDGATLGDDTWIAFDRSQIRSPWGDASVAEQYGQAARGRIRIGKQSIAIDLFASANLSTVVHELGHLYLHVLEDLATEPQGTPEIAADYDTIRAWVGAEEGATLTREQHEQFARGFEAYLFEGKAPSSALREAFARFRAWLVSVYRSVRGLNVALSDDVRQVFDRLLATDEEIQAAQAEQAMVPLFDDPASLGLSDDEAQRYTKAIESANRTATEELTAKLVDRVKREQSAIYQAEREKVRAEVAEQVNQEPVSLAFSTLSRGTLPDGSDLPEGAASVFLVDGKPVKLDRAAIVQAYGADFLKTLPRPLVYAREGGMHPEEAAGIFGFGSADEMLKALQTAVNPTQRIDTLTDERMRTEFEGGDLLTSGELPIEAMKALHSEERSKLLALEMRILTGENFRTAMGIAGKLMRVPSIDGLRAEARRIIAGKRIRDIRPIVYQRAEARAAKEKKQFFEAGDIVEAFEALKRQTLNLELYRAAIEAQETVDGVVTYMATFNKASTRERLGKAGSDYLEQIDAILDRFDFRRSVSGKAIEKRQSLLAFLRQMEKDGREIDIPESVLNEARRQHYKTLSLEELLGLRDSVKQIEHLARTKNRLLKEQRARDLEEAADLASGSIIANARKVRKKDIETHLPGSALVKTVKGFWADHRKYSSLIRVMDGLQDGGDAWSLLVRPLNAAGDEEASRNESATIEWSNVFARAYSPADMRTMYRKELVPGTNVSLSKMGRIMVALNWGTETNRQRVLGGFAEAGWTNQTVQAILDTLDERDLAFVKDVWGNIGQYWPELKQLGKDLHGVEPVAVEPTPFTTRAGTVPGGYFPIAYNPDLSFMARKNREMQIAERVKRGAVVRSRTAQGMLEERVERVNAPIRLDFGVIFEHVGEVIHTLTHTAALMDVTRILSHEKVQTAIYDHYGPLVFDQLKDTLSDIASGDLAAQSHVERSLGWLRHGVTTVGLGWSVMTSLLQPFGLSNSVARIGAKWVGRGVSRWIGDAARMENTVAEVHRRSEFMRLRHKTFQREINEIRNQVGLDTGRIKGWMDEALRATTRDHVTRQKIADSYFWLISRMQMVADIPTWLGQYEKMIADGKDEATAVALADQAVLDSQGGGQIKDLAAVQRGGPFLKVWTNFYSYMSVVHQQLAETTARTNFRKPGDVGRWAVDVLLVTTVPVVMTVLLREAVRGSDDDDESLTEKLVREQLGYLAGTTMFTRELSGTLAGHYDYSGPAGSRVFQESSRLIQQVEQGEADASLWKALNNVAGILLHYPAAQVERSVSGIAALADGTTRNPMAILFGPPRN